MGRRQLDVLIPMVYAGLIVVCALWWKDALTFVSVVGAILTGIYWVIYRRGMMDHETQRRRDES